MAGIERIPISSLMFLTMLGAELSGYPANVAFLLPFKGLAALVTITKIWPGVILPVAIITIPQAQAELDSVYQYLLPALYAEYMIRSLFALLDDLV